MLIKIRREVFTPGEFEIHHEFKLTSRKAICNKYHLSLESTEFYDSNGHLIIGNKIKDTTVIAVQKPAGETVALVLSIVSLVAAAVGATVGVVSAIRARRLQQELANRKSVAASYSYTVRGSTNQARNTLPVGVLLGRCNVCGDVAGLPYSSYDESSSDQDQYIHQLFCYGYSWDGKTKHGGVVLEKDSSFVSTGNPNGYKIHIGDSPLDLYKDFWVDAREGIDDLDDMTHAPASIQTVGPLFNKRVIEEAVTTKLTDEYIERSTATNTTKIGVGVIAPYGYYKANSNGSRGNQACDYEVQYKLHSASAWTTVYRRTAALAVPVYRHMVVIDNLTPGQYDVRVINHLYTTSVSADVVDTLEWDVLQSWTKGASTTGADAPVKNTDRYSLLAVKIRATDQINGYLDKLYTKAHLICRTYTGNYTETSNFENYWTIPTNATEDVGTMNNPASILLYLLTDPKVNPRPIPADKIDWVSLREWFQFCADPDRNWSCNAWVTEQITVGELAQKVCAAGRAMLTLNNGLYGVAIENSTDVVSQIFTPRNAWNMQEVKSYEDQVEMIDASFVNEDTEVQENIYVIYDKENEEFIYKTDSAEIVSGQYKSESVALWGVTNPHQAQQLATYNLCYSNFLSRTYTWECGLESIISAVGDVVYLANDMFLFSLGYGRIKAAVHSDSGSVYTGVVIDSDVALDPTKNYGITVREEDGTITHHAINQDPAHPDSRVLEFVTPISDAVDVLTGNLFIYGDSSEQGKKVKITEIKPGENRTATITAVDYVPAVYTSDVTHTIPPYVSNISKYGSGATFNAGNTRPEIQPQVYAESAIIQYAIGSSGEDHSDIAESDWSDVQVPPTFEKSYLWMRTRNSSADPWSYSCINSAQSALEAFTVTPQYVISSSEEHIEGVPQTDEYVETEDEQPLLDKTYYERYEVEIYVIATELTPFQGVKYYTRSGTEGHYVYTEADVSQGFEEGVNYYRKMPEYRYEETSDYTNFPIGFYENTRPFIWEEDALNWKKGWYVWKRNYIEYASGYSFYTEPFYDVAYTQSLLQACRFEIFSDGFTYDVNKRASSEDFTLIQAKVFMKGYGAVALSALTWDYPEAIRLNYSGEICQIYIPKNTDLESITISISYEYKQGSTDSTYLVLNANNVTGSYSFLGTLTEMPTTAGSSGALIEGDCFNLLTDTNLVAYVYTNGSWKQLGNGLEDSTKADVEVFAQQTNDCSNGYLMSGYKDNNYSFSLGDCYSFLFAQQANINALASQAITLLNGGSIKSDGYVYGAGGSFDLGVAGFFINSQGIAEFVSVRMKNSIIEGKFIHESMETIDASIGSEITAELDSTVHYKHSEAYNVLKGQLTPNTIESVSMTYKGVQYPKIRRTDTVPVSETIIIQPQGSWVNNTGSVIRINQVLDGAVNPPAGSLVPNGETVNYAGWNVSELISKIAQEDTPTTVAGTYGDGINPEYLNLPSGYTQVSYIQANGTQYINTGFYPDHSKAYSITVDFIPTVENQRYCLISNYEAPNYVALEVYNDNSLRLLINGQVNTVIPNVIIHGLNTAILSWANGEWVLTLNKVTTRGFYTFTETSGDPLFIFLDKEKRSSTFSNPLGIARVIIKEDGTTIRDYVACYNSSANGMYERIGNTFATNSGTGTFERGLDVSPTVASSFDVLLKANDFTTVIANSGSVSQSIHESSSKTYTIPRYVKGQSITVSAWGYSIGPLGTSMYPYYNYGPFNVKLNGTTIISGSGSSARAATVVIQGGDTLSCSVGYASGVGDSDYYGGWSFSWGVTKLEDLGITRKGIWAGVKNQFFYLGDEDSINTQPINITSPFTFTGNPAKFNYTGEYTIGLNLCNSDGRPQRTIQANSYNMISALEFSVTKQGTDLLANATKYYHPLAIIQDDDDAPKFDARKFDIAEVTDIHWLKVDEVNNPEIDETNISQYAIYWNGSDLFQISRNDVPVYVLSAQDYVTSDFTIQFTPFGQLAHLLTRDIIPKQNTYFDIGEEDAKYRNVWANTLHGNIDVPLSETLEDTDSFYIQHLDGSTERLIKADMPSVIEVALRGRTGDTGAKGEKGDTFTFEDLTPAQLDELRTDTATVFTRKYSYLVDAEVGDTTITIPDASYNPTADTLIVSVDGVMFAETRDYTKTATGISLVNPVEIDCTFEFQIFRSLTLHEEDYEYFKGDKGDQGAMSENDVKAYCQTYITSNLKGKVIKDVNRDVISLAGIYTYTIAGYVTSDNVKVFINGLLASLGVDYTLSNAGVVTSVNSQAVGTEFIVIRERTYFESEIGTSTTVNQSIVDLLNARVQSAEAKATEAKQYVDSQVENKANKDLSNVTAPHIIDTWVDGTEGYRIWSDGYCEQWGGYGSAYTGYTTKTITLHKRFKDTNYCLIHSSSYNGNIYEGATYTKTEINFSIVNSINYLGLASWKACGYLTQGEY